MTEIATPDEKIKDAVREAYGNVARRFVKEPTGTSCCGPSPAAVEEPKESCCGPTETPAESAGYAARFYSDVELAELPGTVTDASLGCGNPTAIADLKPGKSCSTWGRVEGLIASSPPDRLAPQVA